MKRLHTRRTAAALAVLAAGALALTACAGKPATTAAGAPTTLTTLTPAATSEVDKVTWNVFEGEPQTVDPYKSADYTPNMINSNMCENLLRTTPDYEIEPNLARKFSNPDPLHWVYDLRDDVTFWDGAPMTAEDVAWSMNHNLTDKTSFYNYLYANVASVAVTGAHQVTVTLTKPDYLFNEELASYAGVVVEKNFYEAHPSDVGSPAVGVMCTGPFEYGKWTQGQSISLVRNDHYWNKDLQPKVKNLTFTFLTDSSAITSALLAGQIDGAYSLPPSGVAQLKASTAGKYYIGSAPLTTTLVYSNPSGPMSDLRMRKALQLAIDWKGIADKIYGAGAQPTALSVPPAAFGFAKDDLTALQKSLPAPKSADYAAAKKIVAGIPASVKDRTITMVVPEQAETQQLGVAIKDAANRIGLAFTLKVVPATGYSNYLYDPKTRAGVDILYTQFWPNIPDPMDWTSITAVSGGSFNQYNYAGVDEQFAAARSTADPKERAQKITAIVKSLYDQLLPMVPGVALNNDVWMNNRITGAPATFDYVYYPWAATLGGTGGGK